MSRVSGVVLCTSICESDSDDFDGGPNWKRVNAWLVEHGFTELVRAEDHHGGTKAMQMHVGMAGFNYFESHEDDFAAFVIALDWIWPGNVMLVIQPEEGDSRIWRPAWSRW